MKEVAVETSITGVLVSSTILMGVLVVLSLVAITLMYRYFNQIARHQNEVIQDLEKEIKQLSEGALTANKRLLRSENRFKQLARRQYLYEVQQMKNHNYQKAKDMILRGEKVNKVIENCKISRSEAELILLANKMNKVA